VGQSSAGGGGLPRISTRSVDASAARETGRLGRRVAAKRGTGALAAVDEVSTHCVATAQLFTRSSSGTRAAVHLACCTRWCEAAVRRVNAFSRRAVSLRRSTAASPQQRAASDGRRLRHRR